MPSSCFLAGVEYKPFSSQVVMVSMFTNGAASAIRRQRHTGVGTGFSWPEVVYMGASNPACDEMIVAFQFVDVPGAWPTALMGHCFLS